MSFYRPKVMLLHLAFTVLFLFMWVFTDTTLERNCLMEKVYPKLKEYCRERHGLDFQVWRPMPKF